MEAFSILKFWRNAIAGDEDDSFFDLVFKPPAGGRGGGLKDEFQFIESPSDFSRSKNDFIISKPPSPTVTLSRSTPKLKVFMLGFRKSSRIQKSEPTAEMEAANQLSESSKSARTKCSRAEEASVPSDLTRDHSLRSKIAVEISDSDSLAGAVSPEKSVPMYLKLMRPFHVKASKKAKVTDSVTPLSSPVSAPVNQFSRNISNGYRTRSNLKIVARNLGKIRPAAAIGVETPSCRRRDDSLLEQNDGILGAILHCKRSYSSSSKGFSQLFQSALDPSRAELGRSSL